jgi:hypothetical protein
MNRRTRSRAAVVGALLVGGGAALASCNFLVGVGDYTVGEAGADSTTGVVDAGGGNDVASDQTMDQGSDQAIGHDGPSDAKGDGIADSKSDQGGEAGAMGDAPNGGDAGTADADSGNAEAAVDCGEGLPAAQIDAGTDFQKLVNTCVLTASCDPLFLPAAISHCISDNALAATGALACLTTIADCNGYYACQGERYTTPAECLSSTTPGYCDAVNNVAFDCVNMAAINCVPSGGTCRTYTDSSGKARADCAVLDPCTVTGGAQECSGNNLYTCISNDGGATGVGFGRYCSASSVCATTATGGTGCYFKGNSTCSDGGVSCSGASTYTLCSAAGQLLNFDCTRAGDSCQTDDAGNAGCVRPGCSLGSGCTESCNGGVITVCVGGAPLAIDCKQYGFLSCAGGTGQTAAYCTPF